MDQGNVAEKYRIAALNDADFNVVMEELDQELQSMNRPPTQRELQ